MDTLIFSLLFAVICLVLCLLARIGDKRILVTSAFLCAGYLALDDLVTGLPNLVAVLDVLPGHWNWSGKILSLVFSVIVILSLRLSSDALGLRLQQEHPTVAWVALVFFIVWGACLGLFFKPGVADAETLAFQATMPGLAEEIAYRAIAPAILLGLMNRKPHIDGMPWAVILATSAIFGLWHALSVSHGKVGFDAMSGLFPFLGSIAGGWVRFKTKSLVVPVLGHGVANVAFHLAGGLGA